MQSLRKDIYLAAGTSYIKPFYLSDTNGNPININTHNITGAIKQSPESRNKIIDINFANGDSSNEIVMSIDYTKTSKLKFNRYSFDILFEKDGILEYRLYGNVVVEHSVTNFLTS